MSEGQQRLFEDVSHELRAPLARLQAAAGLAEQKLGDDNKIVMRMNMECERLSRLIDEMLSLARLDHVDAKQGQFDVLKQINQEIEDIGFSQPQRPVNVQNNMGPVLMSKGNGELFSRALSNVFGNVLKHTQPTCPIDIVISSLSKNRYRIEITDHGQGVPEETLNAIFEPFYRQNAQTKGYGLGLSIARRAIERLGGTIKASNKPDKGLSVEIELVH